MSAKKRVLGVLITDSNISLVFDGLPYTIPSTAPNYALMRSKIESGDYTDDDIESLLSIRHMVRSKLKDYPNVDLYIDVDKQEIYYNNKVRLPEVLEKKLLYGLEKGHSIGAFVAFVDNLMQNPSEVAVKELYLFLEKGNMPLTEDGHFLAYKKIRSNYTDSYTGKMDNSVGSRPSIPRSECDPNRNNTCSKGLHFCSWDYLKSMSGQRIVILKINPKDVVSIPSDYQNTKGRACEYEIVGEIKNWTQPVLEGKSEVEVTKVSEVPELPVAPLEVRAENKGKVFANSQSENSPYAWIKEGVKAKLDGRTITVLTDPFRKVKKPWMVEYAETPTKISRVRCSELQKI